MVTQTTKGNEGLTFVLIFSKFMVQRRHKGGQNQDYHGVFLFYGTI